MRDLRRRGPALLALATASLAAAAPLAAQDSAPAVADQCATGSPAVGPECLEAMLAFQAVEGLVGLAGSGGAALPGSSSTLGRRVGSQPRLAAAIRVGGVPGAVPDLQSRTPGGTLSGAQRDVFASVVQGTVSAGLFDGFSPLPTVGGLLSLDVEASAGRVFLPGNEGFDGGTTLLGLGLRLGVLRESFTLPGVTLSVRRRWAEKVSLGSPDDPQGTGAAVDVTTTSLRLTAGKDLLSLGLLGGVGYDRYDADGRIQAAHYGSPSQGGDAFGAADVNGFTTHRTLAFAGVSYTFLVLQLSAEGGWARGFPSVAGREGAAYDPSDGRFFGSLAARLTL